MFKEPADAGDRSADVTPELADQLCVLLGGKPSANAGRRAGLAKPAESPRPSQLQFPRHRRFQMHRRFRPLHQSRQCQTLCHAIGGSEWPNDHLPVATGGLKMRNRHTPRLCVACEAPLGSQNGRVLAMRQSLGGPTRTTSRTRPTNPV